MACLEIFWRFFFVVVVWKPSKEERKTHTLNRVHIVIDVDFFPVHCCLYSSWFFRRIIAKFTEFRCALNRATICIWLWKIELGIQSESVKFKCNLNGRIRTNNLNIVCFSHSFLILRVFGMTHIAFSNSETGEEKTKFHEYQWFRMNPDNHLYILTHLILQQNQNDKKIEREIFAESNKLNSFKRRLTIKSTRC